MRWPWVRRSKLEAEERRFDFLLELFNKSQRQLRHVKNERECARREINRINKARKLDVQQALGAARNAFHEATHRAPELEVDSMGYCRILQTHEVRHIESLLNGKHSA